MIPYSIPYGRQSIDQADIDAVVEVLKSPWLTQGPTIERFEAAMAERCQADFAVAVCNATAALHIACLAAGLGPGDRLWTTPNTFVASANCGRYCGADVDFVDIDPHTWNLDAGLLAQKLDAAERVGKLPKVVVAVAFSGQSCDMQAIAGLAERYAFTLIEDAAHAVGASYDGRPVGCGAHATMRACRALASAAQPWHYQRSVADVGTQPRALVLPATGVGFQLSDDRPARGIGPFAVSQARRFYRQAAPIGRAL